MASFEALIRAHTSACSFSSSRGICMPSFESECQSDKQGLQNFLTSFILRMANDRPSILLQFWANLPAPYLIPAVSQNLMFCKSYVYLVGHPTLCTSNPTDSAISLKTCSLLSTSILFASQCDLKLSVLVGTRRLTSNCCSLIWCPCLSSIAAATMAQLGDDSTHS